MKLHKHLKTFLFFLLVGLLCFSVIQTLEAKTINSEKDQPLSPMNISSIDVHEG